MRKAVRAGDTGHVSKLYVKKVLPNFVAFFFFDKLGIALRCIREMSFSVSSANLRRPLFHCSPPGRWTDCPLVRDSEPIRLLEIPTSTSLYMLMFYNYLN